MGIQLLHFGQELFRLLQLVQDEGQRLLVVTGRENGLGNAPQLREPLVESDDLPLAVHHENPVGRGLQRRS